MIADTISQKIAEAMKAHDEIRLSTLKLLSSAFNYEKIAKQHELTEDEELVVVRRQAKERKEAAESYKNAGHPDRAEKEEKELAILQEFLPPEMGDEEISKIVDKAITETGATTMSDIGKVMGVVMAKTKGAVDGGKVSGLVKAKLGQK